MRLFFSGFPSRPIPLKNNEEADQICSLTEKQHFKVKHL